MLIICYPPESGGKFIGNCLALSKDCYLQDVTLMREQRAGLLPPEKKLQILLQKLSEVGNTWDDLQMGDHSLNARRGTKESVELRNDCKAWWFQCSHELFDIEKITQMWPNHRRIILTNANQFVNYRYGLHKNTDRTIYAHLHQDYIVGLRNNNNDIEFDVNTFFQFNEFKTAMLQTYNALNLTDFNEQYIKQFYEAWMTVINRLRTVPEKITHVHGHQQWLITQKLMEKICCEHKN